MFIVRNDRFGVVAAFALAKDAYAERTARIARTGRNYTVSYMPSDHSIGAQTGFDLVVHLDKVRHRETRK